MNSLEQGTPEWLALRKTKITSTDAAVIMGASPWKTPLQLYHEKLSNDPPTPPNERMRRGLELEPIARELFALQTGIETSPSVVVKDWAMASLDGIDSGSLNIVEIKCPGERDHSIALNGKIPDHYYPQIQHHMFVTDLHQCYYFSFDGMDGVSLVVPRDEEYIARMLEKEKTFYENLMNRVPPEPTEKDYIERTDPQWLQCASRWLSLQQEMKDLQQEEEFLRKELVFLSGEWNTKGGGISLCQVRRKGTVQYEEIPQLKGIDLEPYRGSPITSWRITQDQEKKSDIPFRS